MMFDSYSQSLIFKSRNNRKHNICIIWGWKRSIDDSLKPLNFLAWVSTRRKSIIICDDFSKNSDKFFYLDCSLAFCPKGSISCVTSISML
jgi:hypothetical protein